MYYYRTMIYEKGKRRGKGCLRIHVTQINKFRIWFKTPNHYSVQFSCVCNNTILCDACVLDFLWSARKYSPYNLLSSWSSSVLVKFCMLIILVVLGLVTFITMLYYVERKPCPHYNQNTGYNYLAIFPETENGNTCIETVCCCNPNIGTSTRAESITSYVCRNAFYDMKYNLLIPLLLLFSLKLNLCINYQGAQKAVGEMMHTSKLTIWILKKVVETL